MDSGGHKAQKEGYTRQSPWEGEKGGKEGGKAQAPSLRGCSDYTAARGLQKELDLRAILTQARDRMKLEDLGFEGLHFKQAITGARILDVSLGEESVRAH